MALTQPQRIQISGEMVELPTQLAAVIATQATLVDLKADLLAKDGSIKIFFDKYNTSSDSYQLERQALDGTTYTTITEADVDDAAQRKPSNKFFPTDGSWIKFQPHKHASSEGLPTSSTLGHEIEKIGELTALLDLMVNGQSSMVAADTLAADYAPGSLSMTMTTGGQTPGKLILVEGGGSSGLFKVVTSVGTAITVTEVIVPAGTLPMTTSNVLENIPGFNNTERNHLTSTYYQTVITGLSNSIITAVLAWETTLDTQLAKLNLNTDSRSTQVGEINAAKANINNAKGIIDAWQALPNTGTTGTDSKFVNVNIAPLQSEVSARTTFSSTRNSQITTALGSVIQIADGTFSGSGIYFERFNQINLRINLAGGPLSEYYEKATADAALSQMVSTMTSKSNTFSSELRTEPLSANAAGTTTVTVASTTGFSSGNTVYVMADGLTELTGTISSIAGLNITLSFTVPNTYTKALKARIYKQL